ncbi:MAG: hypothetical protein WC162_00705 [Sphaerochaetaceae bacterium]|nr:hypothetical protein [Sphaerochaetaceae bacterium]
MRKKKNLKIKEEVFYLLSLPEDIEETNLEKLVIISFKNQLLAKQGKKINSKQLLSLTKVDCHNTNAIIQKKALLVMAIEKKFKFHLNDDQYDKCSDIEDLVEFSKKGEVNES